MERTDKISSLPARTFCRENGSAVDEYWDIINSPNAIVSATIRSIAEVIDIIPDDVVVKCRAFATNERGVTFSGETYRTLWDGFGAIEDAIFSLEDMSAEDERVVVHSLPVEITDDAEREVEKWLVTNITHNVEQMLPFDSRRWVNVALPNDDTARLVDAISFGHCCLRKQYDAVAFEDLHMINWLAYVRAASSLADSGLLSKYIEELNRTRRDIFDCLLIWRHSIPNDMFDHTPFRETLAFAKNAGVDLQVASYFDGVPIEDILA